MFAHQLVLTKAKCKSFARVSLFRKQAVDPKEEKDWINATD
jgi:hypothetical protein